MSGAPAGDGGKGAKRRSGIPMRATPTAEGRRVSEPVQGLAEDGRDSGLSSECSTPVNVSPPPHQAQPQLPRRTRMRDIIAASRARLQESERSRMRELSFGFIPYASSLCTRGWRALANFPFYRPLGARGSCEALVCLSVQTVP
jgi:hypothetical protein